MKLRHVYLGLCILGIILPYSLFLPWFFDNGLNIPLFFRELFSTRIGGSFGMDTFVSLAVLFVFAWFEISRLQLRRGLLVFAATLLGTFGAGVSCGFPLFLYFRQRHLDEL
jgi:cation transport ATPase